MFHWRMCFWRLHRLRHGPIDFRFNIVFGCRRSVLLLLLRLRRRRYRRPVFARESTKHVAFLWSTRIRRFAIIDLAILLFLTFWSIARRRRRRRFLFLRILLFIVSRRQSIENARFVVVLCPAFNIGDGSAGYVIRSGCNFIRTLLVLTFVFHLSCNFFVVVDSPAPPPPPPPPPFVDLLLLFFFAAADPPF